MTRKERILQASKNFLKENFQNDLHAFVEGAEWSDKNPDRHESSPFGIALAALNEIMRTGSTTDGNTAEATIAYETLGKLGYWDE